MLLENGDTWITLIPANSGVTPLELDISLLSLNHLIVIGKSPCETEHRIENRRPC